MRLIRRDEMYRCKLGISVGTIDYDSRVIRDYIIVLKCRSDSRGSITITRIVYDVSMIDVIVKRMLDGLYVMLDDSLPTRHSELKDYVSEIELIDNVNLPDRIREEIEKLIRTTTGE